MPHTSIHPATGELLREYPEVDDVRLSATVEACAAAARQWADVSVAARVRPLTAVAALLRDRAEEWATLISLEMGKPRRESLGEVEKCAIGCEYFAAEADATLANHPATTPAGKSYWAYRPLGVILGIMPWNFPFWQAIRFAAPALAAGNGVLLKHAPNVPGCALAIESIFHEAGFPPSLFRTLIVTDAVTQALIGHPQVRGVSLTGSVRAGRAVAETAGRHLKKAVLELGGSDPYVVLEDADLQVAVEASVRGRLINSGQSCIAAKRCVVVGAVHDEFVERYTARMAATFLVEPLSDDEGIGPLARKDLRDDLHRQVTESVAAGARLLTGGEVPERDGWWYPPTVLADVAPGMPAYEEELFGPVGAVIRAEDEDDAIRIANDTAFGLGAAVFTSDQERGERIALERLEAGSAFVNAFVRSHPRLPFGGIKTSGYGRELSPLGLREFVNVKTIWIDGALEA